MVVETVEDGDQDEEVEEEKDHQGRPGQGLVIETCEMGPDPAEFLPEPAHGPHVASPQYPPPPVETGLLDAIQLGIPHIFLGMVYEKSLYRVYEKSFKTAGTNGAAVLINHSNSIS